MTIPMVDLQLQYQTLEPDVSKVVLAAMSQAAYINGPDVGAFEKEMAAYLGSAHAVPVANGTDALHIAMRALDLGPGDEVITTPFTFIATAGAISLTGARPVFVDIDPESYNIDPAAIEAAITPRTKAILPVHLYGNPADMGRILEIAGRHGLAVVEDCAQATGATWQGRKVGTLGTIGCFSFFPSKNLGGFGDGGMVTTQDAELARKMRAIASHGSKVKYHNEMLGFNSRLDTLQAAILRVKLPRLDGWNDGRRLAASRYSKALEATGIKLPQENQLGGKHVYHQYTIRHPERNEIQKHLQDLGLASMVYYPVPLHLLPLYNGLGYGQGAFPRAEAAAAEVLSLPMYPELTEEQVERVASGVREALSRTLSATRA